MKYTPDEFRERIEKYLELVSRYVFLSSARVYGNALVLDEQSPLLRDMILDDQYLGLNPLEYALAKIECEQILWELPTDNWVIVRPYITYNYNRMQLGMYEQRDWLYSVLEERTIVFPKQMATHITTMTSAHDVAIRIKRITERNDLCRNVFLPVTGETHSWQEIIDIYGRLTKDIFNVDLHILYTDAYEYLFAFFGKYQILYDRMYDRKFNSVNTEKLLFDEEDNEEYICLEEGLREALTRFRDQGCPFTGIRNYRWEMASEHIVHLKNQSGGYTAWGMGSLFERMMSSYGEMLRLSYVIDSNPEKWGKPSSYGVECISPEEMIKYSSSIVLIMMDNLGECYKVISFLKKNQIKYKHIRKWLSENGLPEI